MLLGFYYGVVLPARSLTDAVLLCADWLTDASCAVYSYLPRLSVQQLNGSVGIVYCTVAWLEDMTQGDVV